MIDVIERYPDDIPSDVRNYVFEISERNAVRNDRLSAQLAEAIEALNREQITPVVMKGSAVLVSSHHRKTAARIISDLDFMVPPEQAKAALSCLAKLGYGIHYEAPDGEPKWYADLQRPGDVGMIDLHQKPPRSRLLLRHVWRCHAKLPAAVLERRFGLHPFPTYHALMLVIHDQFQDADYWVGKIDLRHLLDLKDLANAQDGVDWKRLALLAPGDLARNAVETQLIALSALLGVDVPAELCSRAIPNIQHRRRMLQIRLPALSRVFLLTALLDYRNYRAALGVSGERLRLSS